MISEMFHTGTDLIIPVMIDPRVKCENAPIKGPTYLLELPKWKPVPRPDKDA